MGRKLKREFGHALTPVTPNRDRYNRPQQQQAKRKGQKVPDRRQELRDDYAASDDIEDFKEKLAIRVK